MVGALWAAPWASVLFACASQPTADLSVLSALPAGTPAAMLASCDKEPYPQLAIGCRVEAAARAADQGDVATINAACAAIPDGPWKSECHFRAGEQLGKSGHTDDSLTECGQAGDFTRFCITHAGWGLPPDDTRSPDALAELAVQRIPGPQGVVAAKVLRARAWFNRYVGTGVADPAVARGATGDDAAPARTAWAIEAVRLTGTYDAAAKAWNGPALSGAALPVQRRVGRYDTFPDMLGEAELPHSVTFADASRFVGESAAEDLDIALIEAVYFNTMDATTEAGAAFVRWLDDPRPRVRYTALRRFRALPSTGVAAKLASMSNDPDPIIRAHVEDALKYHTWLGRPK